MTTELLKHLTPEVVIKLFVTCPRCESYFNVTSSPEPEDVRRDPKPGDVLLAGLEWRLVLGANKRVMYTPHICSGKTFTCSMDRWRKWAATAQVLKVAQ